MQECNSFYCVGIQIGLRMYTVSLHRPILLIYDLLELSEV